MSSKNRSGCLTFICLAIAVTLVAGFCDNKKSKSPEPTISAPSSEPKGAVYNSQWDGSVRQVETWLKHNLKDPDSYEAIEWSPVQESPKGFAVRVKYRAKNSFNGYVIHNQLFHLDTLGNVQDFVDLP